MHAYLIIPYVDSNGDDLHHCCSTTEALNEKIIIRKCCVKVAVHMLLTHLVLICIKNYSDIVSLRLGGLS